MPFWGITAPQDRIPCREKARLLSFLISFVLHSKTVQLIVERETILHSSVSLQRCVPCFKEREKERERERGKERKKQREIEREKGEGERVEIVL